MPVSLRTAIAILALLLLSALPATQRPAQASMYNLSLPGGWAGGHIGWYYNPAGRPANVTDDEVIASVNAAFTAWSKVCRVDGSYLGLTSTATSPTPTNAFVVGWVDFGSTDFEARTGTTRTGSTNFRPTTGGHIEINSLRATDIRTQLDNTMGNMFAGVIGHEVGHALGLAHSDDPSSVMYANPYNNSVYQSTLQGDDIAACADLYGGRGLAVQPDLRGLPVTSLASATMRTYLSTQAPTSTRPTDSLAKIDGSVADGNTTYYAITYWTGLSPTIQAYHRWISPNGNPYFAGKVAATGFANAHFSSSLLDTAFKLPGRWVEQFVADGEVATSVAFDVTAPSVQPFEMALLGERDAASGQLKWRSCPMGAAAC